MNIPRLPGVVSRRRSISRCWSHPSWVAARESPSRFTTAYRSNDPGRAAYWRPQAAASRGRCAISAWPLRRTIIKGSFRTARAEALPPTPVRGAGWRSHRAGITHVHAPVVYRALRPALLLSRRKRVLHVHLDYSDDELIRGLTPPPDLIIVCADFIRRRVEQLAQTNGASHTRVVTIRNAVDTGRFFSGDRRAAKSVFGIDPDRPVVLMAANLAKHKGQETAILAIASLVRRGYKPLLWLAGEQREPGSDYAQRLKALAAEASVSEFVTFLGMRTDVDALLRASDFLLLPSTQEGLPLVILEAQASGTVVLAAPTAGIPEVIEDGRTGFLVGASESEVYGARLKALIDQPDLRERLAWAAREQVDISFTYTRYMRQILSEYDVMMGFPPA